jgi:hypothetical protein
MDTTDPHFSEAELTRAESVLVDIFRVHKELELAVLAPLIRAEMGDLKASKGYGAYKTLVLELAKRRFLSRCIDGKQTYVSQVGTGNNS